MRLRNKNFSFPELMKASNFPTARLREKRRSRARLGKGSAARRGSAAVPVLLLLLAAVVLAVFYFMSRSKGSNEEFAEAQEITRDPVAAEKALADSGSFESQFNAIHEFKKDKITPEDIDIFEKAVEAYGNYLAYAGISATYNPRYEQMRKQLHELRADIIRANTVVLEQDAEAFAAQKKYGEAEPLFSRAAELEYRITKEFPLASKKSHARANFLENRARTMHAIPLQMKAQALAQEGESALDEGNWPKANTALAQALVIEKELWRDYRNVIISNDTRIRRLQTLLTTVASAADYEQREQAVAEARAAEQRGDWDAAAAAWRSALDTQNSIIRNFPQSLYANEAQRAALAVNRANAAAHTEFVEVQKNYTEMRAEIRSRNTSRVALLAKQALRRAEQLLHNEPESTLVPEDFLAELRYMDVKATDIADVQKSFFASLRAVPGAPENVKMTSAEITQALYTFVMPFNPSASNDLLRPVESVDYNDATEFCRRLSLLVGCEVRLPTRAEYAAAAGTPSAEELPDQAWLLENSSGTVRVGKTRAANAAGFYDLYGNVSEWVLPDELSAETLAALNLDDETGNAETFANAEAARKRRAREAPVAGGDCQTPAYAFPAEFFKSVNRSEKSRLRGFRVVADLAKDAQTSAPAVPAAAVPAAAVPAAEPAPETHANPSAPEAPTAPETVVPEAN